MIRSLVLRVSAVLASVAMAFASVAFVAAPAHAASIQLNDSNCDSFSLSGSPPNQVLTCVVSNAPTGCTIVGPTSGTINVPITLTSQCATGSPNAWTWSGGNCANVTTQSCSAVSSSATQVIYSVTPRNSVGSGNSASTTVTWTNTPPQAPSGCTLTAVPSSLPIGGGTTVLTASCTGGGAPTSYAWSGGTLSGSTTTPTQSTNLTQTTTYSVTPSNGGGNGNTAQATVTVAGTSLGFCDSAHVQGFTGIIPASPVVATWGQPATWQSSQAGNFGDGAVWVFKLTVPPGTPNSSSQGNFGGSEYQGPNTLRQMTISTQACDFRPKDYLGVNGPLAVSNGTSVQINFLVGQPFIFGPAGLTAGQTYYINVRNWQLDPTPQPSCGQTSCNAIMSMQPALP